MNQRFQAVVVVILVWAVIYLPALGSIAIKGEEGRRILPAIAMLETDNYIVPEVGGTPYFRKPPLVNWLVAASFRIFGVRNEWTARLPSAVMVLALAVAFVTVARGSLGPRGSIVAALIWMTNIGMIEKGRLIEIEALYISLSGLAIIFWLSFFLGRKSPWLIWIPASIFLGLGLLAKGPIHLIFFYAIVLAVLWRFKEWRLLIHPAPFAGVATMLGIFAMWAVPFLHTTTVHMAALKWSNQFTGRLQGIDFNFVSWIQNIPRGLVYFLPWVLLLPFVRFSKFRGHAERRLAQALAWGITVPFIAVNLIPGALPRYSMPVIAPASWLLAMSYTGHALQWPLDKGMPDQRMWPRIVALFVGVGVVVGGIGYPITAVLLRNRQQVKKAAAEINTLVPPNETLYAVDPEYQPVFFYVKAPLKYVSQVEQLPPDARYFVIRGNKKAEAITAVLPVRLRARVRDYRKRELLLFEVPPK
ncbi:MAG TPA: glycosyltransferase family 39 protein [Candidatus Udaeobacter sp.]|jgi:4-amino-4-deoxy-L-arabinose transferase-like glycosyltransferase|nr:glycosyltransferase family 39 protein [Candidatus Udaeobacter sp.]